MRQSVAGTAVSRECFSRNCDYAVMLGRTKRLGVAAEGLGSQRVNRALSGRSRVTATDTGQTAYSGRNARVENSEGRSGRDSRIEQGA